VQPRCRDALSTRWSRSPRTTVAPFPLVPRRSLSIRWPSLVARTHPSPPLQARTLKPPTKPNDDRTDNRRLYAKATSNMDEARRRHSPPCRRLKSICRNLIALPLARQRTVLPQPHLLPAACLATGQASCCANTTRIWSLHRNGRNGTISKKTISLGRLCRKNDYIAETEKARPMALRAEIRETKPLKGVRPLRQSHMTHPRPPLLHRNADGRWGADSAGRLQTSSRRRITQRPPLRNVARLCGQGRKPLEEYWELRTRFRLPERWPRPGT